MITITFDHLPATPTTSDGAAQTIHRLFDLPQRSARGHTKLPATRPRGGEIWMLRGPSGGGKSLLLRRLVARMKRERKTPVLGGLLPRVVSLDSLDFGGQRVIDCFGDEPLERILRRLSSVGLAEAWTWLRKPSELSAGQQWRLKLVLAVRAAQASREPIVLVADEFGAVLDRVSAMIVSKLLRRIVEGSNGHIGALVATSHDDVLIALDPDTVVECDFGVARMTRRVIREVVSASEGV